MLSAARGPDYERSLLLQTAAGDLEATRTLLDLAGPVIYGFVYARVGGREDIAEDLVQATFLEAVKSATGFRGDSALATWLCAIARHQVAKHYKTERRRSLIESRLRLVGSEPPADIDEDKLAEKDAVIAALGRLPSLHRQVLVMKYLDELSVEEIAGELERSRVQVQSLLQRARAGLKHALRQESDD